jgi:polyphenol oxidase
MVAVDSVLTRRRGLDVLTWPVFDELGVDVVVTTRRGGVSEGPYASLNLGLHVGDDPASVVVNRRRAAAAVGAQLEELVFCNQTHSTRVATVTAADAGRGAHSEADAIDATDALVTADAGVGLVILAADCTPIVLVDADAGVVGCVHSGWRGTVAQTTAAAVAAMVTLGARPERMVAALGPVVAPDGYQVGSEVVAAAEEGLGNLSGLVAPDGTGRWTFDLWEANRRVLTEAGIPEDAVHRSALPTGGAVFFSDRRARPCGRLALIARRR